MLETLQRLWTNTRRRSPRAVIAAFALSCLLAALVTHLTAGGGTARKPTTPRATAIRPDGDPSPHSGTAPGSIVVASARLAPTVLAGLVRQRSIAGVVAERGHPEELTALEPVLRAAASGRPLIYLAILTGASQQALCTASAADAGALGHKAADALRGVTALLGPTLNAGCRPGAATLAAFFAPLHAQGIAVIVRGYAPGLEDAAGDALQAGACGVSPSFRSDGAQRAPLLDATAVKALRARMPEQSAIVGDAAPTDIPLAPAQAKRLQEATAAGMVGRGVDVVVLQSPDLALVRRTDRSLAAHHGLSAERLDEAAARAALLADGRCGARR